MNFRYFPVSKCFDMTVCGTGKTKNKDLDHLITRFLLTLSIRKEQRQLCYITGNEDNLVDPHADNSLYVPKWIPNQLFK